MKLVKIVAVASVLACAGSAYAEAFRCVGMDGTGQKITVIFDESTKTLNINGDILKITSGTVDGKGIATNSYHRDDGKYVYASLVNEGTKQQEKMVLRQFLDKGDVELAVVPLACE